MLEEVRSHECSMHFRVFLARLSEAIRRRLFIGEIDFNDRRARRSAANKERCPLFPPLRTKICAEREEEPKLRISGLKPLISRAPLTLLARYVAVIAARRKGKARRGKSGDRVKSAPHAEVPGPFLRSRVRMIIAHPLAL